MDRRPPCWSTSEVFSTVPSATPTSQRRESWWILPWTVVGGAAGPITESSPRAGSAATSTAAEIRRIGVGRSTLGCSLGRGGRCPPPAPGATTVHSPTAATSEGDRPPWCKKFHAEPAEIAEGSFEKKDSACSACSARTNQAGLAGLLHGGADEDQLLAVARDGAADQQEVVLGDHVDHGQVLHGAAVHAHVPRHALVLEDAARRLALSNGSRVTVQLVRRRAVSRRAFHMVPLEDAGESEAARGAGHVHLVALLEQLDGELRPERVAFQLLLVDPELAHVSVGLLVALLESAEVGLAGVALLLLGQLLVRQLQRHVAVELLGAVPEDEIGLHLDHRHGVRGAVLREHRRHSDFPAEQTLGHDVLLRCLPRHRAHHGQAGLPAGGWGTDRSGGVASAAWKDSRGGAE